MVTQTAAGQQSTSQPSQKATEWRGAAAPSNATHQEGEPPSVPVHSVTQLSLPKTNLPSSKENSLQEQPHIPDAETSQLHGAQFPERQVSPEENEPSPQPEPVNSMNVSPCSQLLDFQIGAEEALIQTTELKTSDIDDILKKVIEEEREKAETVRTLACVKADNQSEDILGII